VAASGVTFHDDEEGAAGTVAEVEAAGLRAQLRRLDVTDPVGASAVVQSLTEALGGLDVFINNAGIGSHTPFLDLDLDEWRTTIETDLTGAFVCGQQAARLMVGRPGAHGRGAQPVICAATVPHAAMPRWIRGMANGRVTNVRSASGCALPVGRARARSPVRPAC
jgi:hypothetical protein